MPHFLDVMIFFLCEAKDENADVVAHSAAVCVQQQQRNFLV